MRHASLLLALVVALPVAADIGLTVSDVQYTTDPSGDSPYANQQVTLQGIVYGLYPTGFAMADAAGAWNGIFVYNPDFDQPAVGDLVTVAGLVKEYFGLTEVTLKVSEPGNTPSLTVDSSGNTPYPTTPVATADIATGAATAESYEGVLVEVQDVTVTDADLGYGEWAVDDGGSARAAARVDDWVGYWYVPVLDDTLDFVRGMLYFSFSDFKIEPRGDDDISATSGPPTPYLIGEIQGSSFVSPHVGENVTTAGVVTGFFEGNTTDNQPFDGVFLQDPDGDADDATSDGIFVHSDEVAAGVALGNLVEVTGLVREYGEYEGWSCTEGCTTTIHASSFSVTGTGAASAVVLDPPTDTDGDFEYLEAREGMLVSVDGNATVVGPTSYGAIAVVDEDEGVDRVLRGSDQHGKVVGARHWERYGDIGGADPDNLIVGSTAAGIVGPLTTTYGAHTVITQAGAPWTTATSAPVPVEPPAWPPASDGTFTVLTVNAHNLDAGASTHLDKLVPIVVEAGCPTFVLLQEVDTVSSLAGSEDEVLSELVTRLATEGCAYASAFSHPDIGDHGVAALWRSDQVTGATSTSQYQGCSEVGSTSSTAYDDHCDAYSGQYPLFSRRPLVVTGTVVSTCPGSLPVQVTLIVAHLKSMTGGAPAAQRRLEQAQFIGDLVDTFVAGGDERVIVAGDLNDFEDSAPLAALVGAEDRLVSVWDSLGDDSTDRYSYNYQGVSQVLDYILHSQALAGRLRAAGPLHFNADFPFNPFSGDGTVPWKASDHDPVAATYGACVDELIFMDGFESGDTSGWS